MNVDLDDATCPRRHAGHTPMRALRCSCGLLATAELVPGPDMHRGRGHEHRFAQSVWACSSCGRAVGDRAEHPYEPPAAGASAEAALYLHRILRRRTVGELLPLMADVAKDVGVDIGDVIPAFTALERHGVIEADGRRYRKLANPPAIGS